MRLLEKVEKMEKHKKTPTPPAHSSGNFKSKLQFQGMNPINISFKIGFAFFFLFLFSFSFPKCKNPTEQSPLPKVWQEKAFFGNGLNPKQSGSLKC